MHTYFINSREPRNSITLFRMLPLALIQVLHVTSPSKCNSKRGHFVSVSLLSLRTLVVDISLSKALAIHKAIAAAKMVSGLDDRQIALMK